MIVCIKIQTKHSGYYLHFIPEKINLDLLDNYNSSFQAIKSTCNSMIVLSENNTVCLSNCNCTVRDHLQLNSIVKSSVESFMLITSLKIFVIAFINIIICRCSK